MIPSSANSAISSGEEFYPVREDLILESHKRCSMAGVNKNLKQPVYRLDSLMLRQLLQRNETLLSYAHQLFAELYDCLTNHSLVFILTDDGGYIMGIYTSADMLEQISRHCGIRQGISLMEESCGTTATGLALRHNEVAIVNGRQHYCEVFQTCSSAARPVNGSNGSIIGCVSVSTPSEGMPGEHVAMVYSIGRELSLFYRNAGLDRAARKGRCQPLRASVGHQQAREVKLTKRQKLVLSLFASGLSYKEIARQMGLESSKTVEEHLDAVRGKLGVKRRRQCIQRAVELGLLGKKMTAREPAT